MGRHLTAAALAAMILLAFGAAAGAGAPSASQPALRGVQDAVERAETYAGWACVLSALALAGVLWVGWSMRTLAKNQVEVARLVIQAGQRK